MNQQLYKIFVLFLFCLAGTTIYSQTELGNPYVKNYSPKEYKSSATIWDITQDNKGLMYFGVSGGVLQYDGTEWRIYAVENQTTVRALDVSDDGLVYVGAKNEFGYLSQDSLNNVKYVSLSKKLGEENLDFADVWNVYVTKEGVFFLTFKKIFRWHNDELKVYDIGKLNAHLGFYVNETLYVVTRKEGLFEFKDNKFELVKGAEKYQNIPIFCILPKSENEIIIGTRQFGLEKFNTTTGEKTPFENAINEKIISEKIYHATVSENKEIVIATLTNGVYVLDYSGKLLMHLSKNNGLIDDNVKYVFKDKFGGLWAGTAVGISYVDLNLPLTYYTSKNGIEGYSRDVIRFNDIIYVATGNGIYYLDESEREASKRFKKITQSADQFWKFTEVNGHLIVGGSHGLFEIKGKSVKKLFSFGSNAVFNLLQSKKDSNRIYLALKNGLAIAEVQYSLQGESQIKVVKKLAGYTDETHYLAEDIHGDLWAATAFDYLIKFEAKSFIKGQNSKIAYSKIEHDEKLSKEGMLGINDKVYFTSSDGLYGVDSKGELIKDSLIDIEGLTGEHKIRRLSEDRHGNLWIHYHISDESGEVLALKQPDGSFIAKENPFTRIKEKLSHVHKVYVENNGVAWYVGGEGVVRYDYNKDLTKRKNYNVNIRKVILHRDSIISYGNKDELNIHDYTFSFDHNATTFSFSAASYGNETENTYQFYLEGYDKEWSDWTYQSKKEYSFIHEGEYIFRVRAKNIYNQISKEDQFTFVILPPWYREVWAYVLYVFLFLVLIFVVIKISTYRLLKAKNQLTQIVEERTKDILIEKQKVEKQKEEIEEVHKELSLRNEDVMASIKYAQRIQASILPPIERFKNEFKEGFIFYKPRDIVSGDFYWYEKLGDNFIIAVADCTGHGVPGAFMSMICSTLLNKVVEKESVNSPELALTILNNELIKSLRQKDVSTHTGAMDGMDVALIVIDQKNMSCSFSGAYRPLVLIRDGELLVFKGNRYSLGGGFVDVKKFEKETIELKSGDVLYSFTDGLVDQFGGEKNKKYKVERFKKLLLEINDRPMSEQYALIEKAFNDWKEGYEQIDDVLVVGLKIP